MASIHVVSASVNSITVRLRFDPDPDKKYLLSFSGLGGGQRVLKPGLMTRHFLRAGHSFEIALLVQTARPPPHSGSTLVCIAGCKGATLPIQRLGKRRPKWQCSSWDPRLCVRYFPTLFNLDCYSFTHTTNAQSPLKLHF